MRRQRCIGTTEPRLLHCRRLRLVMADASLNAANGVFLVSLAAGYGRGLALLRHGRGIRGRWIHAFCLCLWPSWPFTGGGVAVAEGRWLSRRLWSSGLLWWFGLLVMPVVVMPFSIE